jgi:hypothetical protein
MTTQEVIDKYFKDDKVLFFQSSDYHRMIEGDTCLKYEKTGKIELWFSGNNGEVCLIATDNGDKLKAVIEAIIYG